MTLDNANAWLDREVASRALTVLVFFRGSWCPFCQGYLREMNKGFATAIRKHGGELIAITSQSEGAAKQAHDDWGLGYPVHSDPANVLARRFDVAITPKAQTVLADDPKEYPAGMAQPAVVALDRTGQVIFRWAIDPNEMNLGGATDRPLPHDILEVIEAELSGESKPLGGESRLDVGFLAEHYPEQHAAFQAWVASLEPTSSR